MNANRKKGFTLIELLAVIVILAIIALIATPVIFNTIEKSKKGSFEQTLINIGKGVKLYKAKIELDEEFKECRYFSFSDDVTEVTKKEGKTYYPLKELSLKGNLPTDGEIKVCDETIAIIAGDSSYSGRYENGETTVVDGGILDNDLQPPVIELFNTTSTRHKIIVILSAHSQKQDGEIINYYYKINDGKYIKTTEPSYVFEGLSPETEYTITVMVENKSGIKKEESKQVSTSKFEELIINVEKSNEWTSSKTVTIEEAEDGYKAEYKIRKYNEATKELEESEFIEYTGPITLDTMATTEYPILIIARYNDNGTYSDEKTYTVVNIDTTAPNSTKPVVNVSTTKPTSEASVVIRQTDEESELNESTIEYGYSLDNVEYTWQASSELKKLKAGTTYYIKTRVANNVGKTTESEPIQYKPGEISACSVEILTSGWAVSKNVKITGTQTGVELQYQIGSTSENGWTTIDNEGTLKIEENTSVYCRLWDGTTAGATGTGFVEQIDKEEPTIELKTEELATNNVTIPYEANDTGAGADKATCVYGTDTKYGSNGTVNSDNNKCIISGLKADTTYYYQICVSDKVGNGPVCVEGNTKPASMQSPKVIFNNTPSTSVNGYYKEQTAQVTYITTGITNPRYFVKTDRVGTSNLTVTKSCGTESIPTSCTEITGTVILEPNIWYEVSGNVNVTYNTETSEVGTIYATTYDGTNFITPAPTGTLSKIDRTKPELTLGNVSTTTNSAIITYTSSDAITGLQKATCKYSDKQGSYTISGTVNEDNNSCTLSGLTTGRTYYYQICVSDGVGNGPECKEGTASALGMPKPSITFTNTPTTAVNGYLDSQVAKVTYTATGIKNPRYFVKTTRAGVSSLTVTKSCGTDSNPSTNCTEIAGTTTLSANTWYEVSGNVNVTYSEYSASTGTIYAAIYDGTNFIDPIPSGTISKITKQTNYTVRHYQMNTDMTNYTLVETETLSGKVGYSVTPSVKTYDGFNSPSTKTATLADGTTVVDYHYPRKQVIVTFYRNHSTSDTTTATQTFTYGVSGQSFSNKGWSKSTTSNGTTYTYTLIGWSESATSMSGGIYSPLNGVNDSYINGKSPSTNLYAVWVQNPAVTFVHNPATLANGYAMSSVATVTYSSTNVTSPVYYIKTTRTGTSSVAVTQSCGTGNSPGTCTAISSTTTLAENTWYRIGGNTTVTYNTAATSTGILYAYTYDGTTARAPGSGTIPMIDKKSPTIELGTATASGNTITVNYTLNDSESGIGSVTCTYAGAGGYSPYVSVSSESYTSTAANATLTSCTMTGLNEYQYYPYKVCVTDKVGNTTSCSTGGITTKDTTKPSVPTVKYNSGSNSCAWQNNYNYSLTSTDAHSGISTYQIDWDGDGNPNGTVAANFIPWNGFHSHNVRFRAVDNAGNVSDWTSSHHIHMDTEAPGATTVKYNSGSNTCSWKNNYNISLSASDNTGIAYYEIDWHGNGTVDETTGSNFIPGNGYSTCNAIFRAVDNAGNRGAWTSVHHIHMDTQAPSKPTINLNGYTSGNWTTGNVTISASSSDNVGIAGYQYSHDKVNISSFSNPWTISWTGQWTFYVRSYDHAGNYSAWSDAFVLKVDKCDNMTSSVSYGAWGAWGACSASCGGGVQYAYRTKTITYSSTTGSGLCTSSSSTTESTSQSCNTHACGPTNFTVKKIINGSWCSGGSVAALASSTGASNEYIVAFADGASYYQICSGSNGSGCSNLSVTSSTTCMNWAGSGGRAIGMISYSSDQGYRYIRACNSSNVCTGFTTVYIK